MSEDRLLGGRVVLRQPERGLRAGLDAVMLAAAVPAKPGETLLEAGAGTGAAILCVMARVPGLRGVAVERDPELCALLRENVALNGADVTVIEGDIADPETGARLPRCDRAFANPPYWPGGTRPPDPLRAAATHEDGLPLDRWTRFCAGALRRRGSLTLILPAGRLSDGLAALRAADCRTVWTRALHPHAAVAARRVVLIGRRWTRGEDVMLPGVVLHEPDGAWTPAAGQILNGTGVLFSSHPPERWSLGHATDR